MGQGEIPRQSGASQSEFGMAGDETAGQALGPPRRAPPLPWTDPIGRRASPRGEGLDGEVKPRCAQLPPAGHSAGCCDVGRRSTDDRGPTSTSGRHTTRTTPW